MKTTEPRLRKSHMAMLAAVLAIIAGFFAFFCSGAQQDAWADESGETIFTSGSISSLPFSKTSDGITVEIFAEEEEDATETDTETDLEDDADSADSSAAGSESKSSSSSAKESSKTVTIEITADDDIDAEKVVIEVDGSTVTKDISGKKLKADDTVTFTLDNCTKVTKLTVYGPEKQESASGSDNSRNPDQGTSGSNSNSQNGTSQSGSNGKSGDSGKSTEDGNSNNDVTISTLDDQEESTDEPLRVSLIDDEDYSNNFVVYVKNGKSFSTGTTEINGGKTVSIEDYQLTREGYNFIGWKIDGSEEMLTDGTIISTSVTASPVFEAAETPLQPAEASMNKVTLVDESAENGGYIVYVESGQPFGNGKLNPENDEVVSILDFNPVKNGYKFTGKWIIKETGETLADSTIINEDVTAEPVFEQSEEPVPPATDPEEPASYTVSFDSNGHGKAPSDIKNVTAGSTVDLSQKSISAEGYRFTGWYTDSKCGNWFDAANTPITSNTKLYAGWAKQVTVTYDMGKHGGSKAADTVDQGTPVPEFANPTENGWCFERWITDTEETFYPGYTPVNQDMTVHAVWVENIPLDQSQSIEVEQKDTDAKTFDIVVTKVSVDDGTCLEGAEFTLKDKDGNVIGSWTSGKSGVLIEKLRQDTTYVLIETKAPNGYGVERPININYAEENGKPVVKIDQGGNAVVNLPNNNDGIATLNVKDASGKSKSSSTTMPLTGDNQNLPLAGLCFGGAAAIAASVAFMAYRKRKLA